MQTWKTGATTNMLMMKKNFGISSGRNLFKQINYLVKEATTVFTLTNHWAKMTSNGLQSHNFNGGNHDDAIETHE